MISHFDCYGQSSLLELFGMDNELVRLANDIRIKLSDSPSQSEFRVIAILIIETSDGVLKFIEGSNSEQGYIGGAICAERAAICRLRFLKEKTFILKKVIVVTDSSSPLSPGALCREYLISHGNSETLIVMGNNNGEIIKSSRLSDLWPYPYLYRFKRRQQLLDYAKIFSGSIQGVADLDTDSNSLKVYSSSLLVNKNDKHDRIHPLRLSAAVLFTDGSVDTAWQLKGLEYGCTLDPVCQLIREIEKRSICIPCSIFNTNTSSNYTTTLINSEESTLSQVVSIKPVLITMTDQFGVCHAPFAQGRSLLQEHGYGYLQVLVHNEDGQFVTTSVDELIPQPSGSKLLSHDDFI